MVDNIPALDDVAYVNADFESMGGRGAIVALTLGRLGAAASLLTVLPENTLSHEYIELLRDNNVETEGVRMDANASSLFEVIVAISRQEENCISFFVPSDIELVADDIQKQRAATADIAYFSTHKKSFNETLLNEINPEDTLVIHNVSSYFLTSDEYIEAMLAKSHMLISNELEAEALLNKMDCSSADEVFNSAPYLETIIVTHGSEGSQLYKRTGEIAHFDTRAIDAVAPVGAGDAYAAGIVYGTSQGWEDERSVSFATELACISVESHTSYPSLERLDALSRTFEERL
jgi:sugar/nucleoside kinase (ribokinase family)